MLSLINSSATSVASGRWCGWAGGAGIGQSSETACVLPPKDTEAAALRTSVLNNRLEPVDYGNETGRHLEFRLSINFARSSIVSPFLLIGDRR